MLQASYIVVFEKEQCPNIPYYLFVWYIATCFKRFYQNTHHNFKHMEFGNVFENIGRLFSNITGISKLVDMSFTKSYRDMYKDYINFIK